MWNPDHKIESFKVSKEQGEAIRDNLIDSLKASERKTTNPYEVWRLKIGGADESATIILYENLKGKNKIVATGNPPAINDAILQIRLVV